MERDSQWKEQTELANWGGIATITRAVLPLSVLWNSRVHLTNPQLLLTTTKSCLHKRTETHGQAFIPEQHLLLHSCADGFRYTARKMTRRSTGPRYRKQTQGTFDFRCSQHQVSRINTIFVQHLDANELDTKVDVQLYGCTVQSEHKRTPERKYKPREKKLDKEDFVSKWLLQGTLPKRGGAGGRETDPRSTTLQGSTTS